MNCVVNVACGAWFPKGQDRLRQSLDTVGFKGEKLFWRDVYPVGCPTHQQSPCAYKPYVFLEAKKSGHDLVLWCDAAVWAVKDVSPLFEEIDKHGYLLFDNGPWKTGQWCSDKALVSLGMTRDEAMDIPHLMACVIGLKLSDPTATEFLRQWMVYANDGVTFPGPIDNKNGAISSDPRCLGHRYDQTAASVIAHRLGMRRWLTPHETYLLYHNGETSYKESIVLLTRGM